MKTNQKQLSRKRRHGRIRSVISGTADRPRLAVFKSNKYIYAQLIDDVAGATLACASDIKEAKGTKMDRAKLVGESLATSAKTKKITSVVFDRGGFSFAGRVKALADSAREGGLVF
ncbi:MAG: 50S ribosomal protein L18 [Candidatus Nomurabacteria bacterium]|nr:50S ribosomal protein L18 [Candidatus Nomurabacteria bacterium]